MKTFDISVRISRVGKRNEDRLYSDDNQEEACRAQAEKEGGNVGIVTVEKNVSGGKAAKQRELERLIKRVEDKLSNGIIVYDFSRFSREEPFKAMMLVGRVHNAGGVVIGVADNYRSDAPMAVVMTALYAEQAHNYIKVARERTAAGRDHARQRGAYMAKTPPCYDRDEMGVLIENEHSHLVDELFKLRLAGEGYTDLVRYASDNGLQITVGGMRTLLGNPVYIGESENGPSPALTDKDTFERVQRMSKKRFKRGPKTDTETLAQGIAMCMNCGSTLIVTHTPTGLMFYCRGQKLGGCTRRGSVMVERLDAWLDSLFCERAESFERVYRAYADESSVSETRDLMNAKSFELEQIKKSTSLISTLGIAAFETMVSDAQAAYEIAAAAHHEAKENADLLGGMTKLIDLWRSGKLSLAHKRRLLGKVVSRVEVGTGRIGIEDKCRVIFADGTVFNPHDAGALLDLVQH